MEENKKNEIEEVKTEEITDENVIKEKEEKKVDEVEEKNKESEEKVVEETNENNNTFEPAISKASNFDSKKIIKIVIVILVVIALGVGIYCYINRDKTPKTETVKNTTKEVISGTVLNGLKIRDITIETTNGMTVYKGIIENTTKEVIPVNGISATFYENEKEVGTIEMYINKELQPGETADLNNSSDMDFSRATNVKYQVIS